MYNKKTLIISIIIIIILLLVGFDVFATTIDGREVYEYKENYNSDYIDDTIQQVCASYLIDPCLVKSIIYHESSFRPNVSNGNHIGLMQVSTKWHSDRAYKLGVTNFYNIHDNILLGVDYISELFEIYDDPALVLMMYNMRRDTALKMYNDGDISEYAMSVLTLAEYYR